MIVGEIMCMLSSSVWLSMDCCSGQ